MYRWKPLILLLGAYGLVCVLLLTSHYLLFPMCPFKLLTGCPCPGCGGTRAFFALLHGDVITAIYTNPLSVMLILFAAIVPIWVFCDCLRGTKSFWNFLHKKWNPTTITIVVIIIAANWIWNIYKQL